MNIDYQQLHKDREEMRRALPLENNEAWESWDRISFILFELEQENKIQQRLNYLRQEIEQERISYGEIDELQSNES